MCVCVCVSVNMITREPLNMSQNFQGIILWSKGRTRSKSAFLWTLLIRSGVCKETCRDLVQLVACDTEKK